VTMKPHVIIGIGLPGSGKSTILRPLSADMGAVYICPDNIRTEVTGDASDQSQNPLVWRLAYDRLKRALESGETVVFDATNAKASDRLRLAGFAKDYAGRVEGIWFQAPITTCLARNRQRTRVVPEVVIGKMYNELKHQPPTLAEGFDTLEIRDTTEDIIQ
jgi:predicted kinase